MTPIEACQLVVDLFEWDEDGVVGPTPPYSWMTVASIAGDYAKGALADQHVPISCAECGAVQPPGGRFHLTGCSSQETGGE